MNPARIIRNVDTYRLLGECLVNDKEMLLAAENYSKGLAIYEPALQNKTIKRDKKAGILYSDVADLEYFITGDLKTAYEYYNQSVANLNDNGSVRYKMGYIQYSFEDYQTALNQFSLAFSDYPDDKNLMYAMGNALFHRGDYAAAQGYYSRIIQNLNSIRPQFGNLLPQTSYTDGVYVEQYMKASNNLGVSLYQLALLKGDSKKSISALTTLTESLRAYDALTRNPDTMVRLPGSNLAELNIKYITHPNAQFKPGIYGSIDNVLENQQPIESIDSNNIVD